MKGNSSGSITQTIGPQLTANTTMNTPKQMTVVHAAPEVLPKKRLEKESTIKLMTIPAFPNNKSGFRPILSMKRIATSVIRTLTVPMPTVPKMAAESSNPTFVNVFGA